MPRIAVAAALCWGLVSLPGCGRTTTPPAHPTPDSAPAGESANGHDNVTGAIDSLPAKSFKDQHFEDIAELLQHRVAGLQVTRLPNGDITLRIRGGDLSLQEDANGSIGTQQEGEPLLVIDGMPVSEGQLSNTLRALNPNAIKNIKVLKDVSSTSFYGIRGAHGVILITMKNDQL